MITSNELITAIANLVRATEAGTTLDADSAEILKLRAAYLANENREILRTNDVLSRDRMRLLDEAEAAQAEVAQLRTALGRMEQAEASTTATIHALVRERDAAMAAGEVLTVVATQQRNALAMRAEEENAASARQVELLERQQAEYAALHDLALTTAHRLSLWQRAARKHHRAAQHLRGQLAIATAAYRQQTAHPTPDTQSLTPPKPLILIPPPFRDPARCAGGVHEEQNGHAVGA